MSTPVPEQKTSESAKTLIWLSGILLLTGMTGMSPALVFFCAALAVLSAGIAILIAKNLVVRIVSVLITIGSIYMVLATYPGYKSHMDEYHQRTLSSKTGSQ